MNAIEYHSITYEIPFSRLQRCKHNRLELFPFVSWILHPTEWRVGKVALV